MSPLSGKNDARPVVLELKDFDRNSVKLVERVIFNHRLAVIIVCVLATLVLGYLGATQLVLNASFEKMIPQSQPYIIVSQSGHIIESRDDGASFALRAQEQPVPASAVIAEGKDGLLVSGTGGLHRLFPRQ